MALSDRTNTPRMYRTPVKPALPQQARGSLEADLAAAKTPQPAGFTPQGRQLAFKKYVTGTGDAIDRQGTKSHALAKKGYNKLQEAKHEKQEAERILKALERKVLREEHLKRKTAMEGQPALP
jgi:hypothetical protein